MPLIVLTAALTLFRRQHLPPPWTPMPASSSPAPSLSPLRVYGRPFLPPSWSPVLPYSLPRPTPLIIYGASSALGSFAIKLAKASNIHPIIAIAGGSHAYVDTLLDASRGDRLVDYRNGAEKMKEDVKTALNGLVARNAIDCISANGTWVTLTQLVDPNGGIVSVVSGVNKYDESEIPEGVKVLYTYVGTVHDGAYLPSMPCQPVDKEEVRGDVEWAGGFVRYLSGMLGRGEVGGHPFVVIPKGLEGVEGGLRRLKNGEAGGRKFVYRVGGEVGQ